MIQSNCVYRVIVSPLELVFYGLALFIYHCGEVTIMVKIFNNEKDLASLRGPKFKLNNN